MKSLYRIKTYFLLLTFLIGGLVIVYFLTERPICVSNATLYMLVDVIFYILPDSDPTFAHSHFACNFFVSQVK